MNARTQRAAQMMQERGAAQTVSEGTYSVRSQTDPAKSYIVRETPGGLVCECPDHQYRDMIRN